MLYSSPELWSRTSSSPRRCMSTTFIPGNSVVCACVPSFPSITSRRLLTPSPTIITSFSGEYTTLSGQIFFPSTSSENVQAMEGTPLSAGEQSTARTFGLSLLSATIRNPGGEGTKHRPLYLLWTPLWMVLVLVNLWISGSTFNSRISFFFAWTNILFSPPWHIRPTHSPLYACVVSPFPRLISVIAWQWGQENANISHLSVLTARRYCSTSCVHIHTNFFSTFPSWLKRYRVWSWSMALRRDMSIFLEVITANPGFHPSPTLTVRSSFTLIWKYKKQECLSVEYHNQHI